MLRHWGRKNPYFKQLQKLFHKAEKLGLAELNTVRAIMEEKDWEILINNQGKYPLKRPRTQLVIIQFSQRWVLRLISNHPRFF